MTDNITLLRKLTALSIASSMLKDGSRVVSNGTFPQPLLAIFAEVDDTVLMRKLVFSMGSEHMSAIAAGRRLLSVEDTSLNAEAYKGILGHTLSADDDKELNIVAELLTDFVESEGRLIVKQEIVMEAGDAIVAGVPISMVMELMGVDLEDEQQSPLPQFLDDCEDIMSACVFYFGDELAGETGPDENIEQLQSVLNNQWDSYQKDIAPFTSDDVRTFLICLDDAMGAGHSLCIAKADSAIAVFSTLNEDTPDVQDNWGKIFVL